MAKISTLVYVLEEDRNELIDAGEIFELENSLLRDVFNILDQNEFTAKPELVSKILKKSLCTEGSQTAKSGTDEQERYMRL